MPAYLIWYINKKIISELFILKDLSAFSNYYASTLISNSFIEILRLTKYIENLKKTWANYQLQETIDIFSLLLKET